MFKFIVISSLLLGGEAVTQNSTEPYELNSNSNTIEITIEDPDNQLDLKTIEYIEDNEEFDLGFDTTPYLPKGFDPYLGSLDAIEYVDIDAELEVGANIESDKYLPHDFDPYIGTLSQIKYIDLDELDYETSFSMSTSNIKF
ncbi:hypothetical protein SAMN04487906_3294 [Zhouia amylolytica]|uniref:Uncharacterized protein n=2 Tax=Zhouia amylolytica TaxID=376730 RepID=W2UJ19_9FLAO|nr:hypothetical protein [Zhouia amylolytica]ETN93939.1 hypothetical protein P278_33500 [Zhouia amylolytica AD3]SFT16176.1 hypothetical protein SAMN04487906_3294 [Zhouia amylolytica]